MAFSSSIMLADLDYIAPSQSCIKPMMVKQDAPQQNPGLGRQIGDGSGMSKNEIVKISLQDCLACSGCVTSAETMLVEKQSKDEILTVLNDAPNKPVGVSISDQSAASIAVQLGVGIPEAMQVVAGFARDVLRADVVVDLRWADRVSVFETAVEFVDRVRNRPEALPMIVSSCPGWVCYCEKSHPTIIPYLCQVKSGQAIAAEYIKEQLKAKGPADAAHVASASFHISIQPCFDKKLEAVRDDFADTESGDRYTDFVISSAELLEWMREIDEKPETKWNHPLDSTPDPGRPPCDLQCDAATMEGSGGFHQFALQFATKELLGNAEGLPYEQIQYVTKRNANHRVIPFQMPNGATKEFCVAYGFQHIQNIVRGINRKMASTAKYCFVELMACPDGCLNGGGQIRTRNHNETQTAVNTVFRSYLADIAARGDSPDSPSEGPAKVPRDEDTNTSREEAEKLRSTGNAISFENVYSKWLKAPPGSAEAHAKLCTQFHDRKAAMEEMMKETPIAQSLKW